MREEEFSVTCDSCKHKYSVKKFVEINHDDFSDSYSEIREAKMMKHNCPKCGSENIVGHHLTYINDLKKIEVLYTTDLNEVNSFIESKEKEDYIKRVFYNDYDSFVEDIYFLLNDLNEYIMNVYKMGIYQRLSEGDKKVLNIHFNGSDYEIKIFEAIIKDKVGNIEPRRVAFENQFYGYLKTELNDKLVKRDPKIDYIINFELINNILLGKPTPLHLVKDKAN